MTPALLRKALGLVDLGRLKTLSLVTFSHGFVAIAFFLQMVSLVRVLPVAEFGHLATLLAVSVVMEAAVGARGSETALAVFAQIQVDDDRARYAVTRRLLRLDLAWSIVLYGILGGAVVAYDAVTGTRSGWLLILMIGSFIAFPWGTLKSYLTVFKGPRAFPLIEISYAAVALIAGVGLSFTFGGAGFAAGMVLASLARSVLCFRQARLPLWVYYGRAPEHAPPDKVLWRKRLWWFGATGTVRAGLLNLAGQMDILLLAAAGSPSAVGLYRAAKTLSGMVQRLTQPIWFVLKRHIIVSHSGGDPSHSRQTIFLASLGFFMAGIVVVPPVIYFGGDIAALAFGSQYRASAQALVWLLPGAWILFAMTGWSNLFGSIANARLTVIGIYVVQIGLFALVALTAGVTMASLALALALSQVFAAAGFWLLFLRRSSDRGPSPQTPMTDDDA